MLGYIILVLAILLYLFGYKRISLLIFMTFMLNGSSVLTDTVLGVKNYDLAFIYTLSVLFISLLFESDNQPINDIIFRRLLCLFMIFMFFDIYFSLKHYHFSYFQILQGSRASFLFLSYFFLRKAKKEDFIWLINVYFYITLIISVLYIIQVFFDAPVLPYDTENIKRDDYTGIMRYYNHPPLIYWYIFVSILHPSLIKFKYTYLSSFIFITALIATQGRIQIGATFFVLSMGILIQKRAKSLLGGSLIAIFVISLFYDMLGARFDAKFDNSTESEIESIFSGGIGETVRVGNAFNTGTLTYRLAWYYERALYLHERPLGEKLFGLGLISDSQYEVIRQLYAFSLGIKDEDGQVVQLSTPDISYGNILTKYGYLGGLIFLSIWFYLLFFFYNNRHKDALIFISFLLIVCMILISFAGNAIFNHGNFIIPFFLYIMALWVIQPNGKNHYSLKNTKSGVNKKNISQQRVG